MIAEKIEFEGREAYDVGWGIIVWPWKRKKGATAELYVKPDLELADEYGACYIATETGKCQGIYYVMRSDDCRRFVMDKRTQGTGQRGTHWSYYWTTLRNLVEKGGLETVRFTHDTGKMDAVLDDLGITPLTKDEIKRLFARIGYLRREDARGLMPGIIYKIDEAMGDVDVSHPVDLTGLMIELDRRGSTYDAAVYDGGWVSYHSNLGVASGVLLRGPIVITYDNKYR